MGYFIKIPISISIEGLFLFKDTSTLNFYSEVIYIKRHLCLLMVVHCNHKELQTKWYLGFNQVDTVCLLHFSSISWITQNLTCRRWDKLEEHISLQGRLGFKVNISSLNHCFSEKILKCSALHNFLKSIFCNFESTFLCFFFFFKKWHGPYLPTPNLPVFLFLSLNQLYKLPAPLSGTPVCGRCLGLVRGGC